MIDYPIVIIFIRNTSAKRKKLRQCNSMCSYLLQKKYKYTYKDRSFYKHKDRLVNIDIAKNDRRWAKHFSPTTFPVLYKLNSCKHLVNSCINLHVSHSTPLPPPTHPKKLM